jgi:hypothetical protein
VRGRRAEWTVDCAKVVVVNVSMLLLTGGGDAFHVIIIGVLFIYNTR